MRAKMSDPRHYDLCQCVLNQQYYGFGCQCAENAVAEVRAILAETETDGLTLTTHHGGRGGGGMLGCPEGCAALAESLAAFVEA